MLVADIKIVPFGDWDHVRPIRRLCIANTGHNRTSSTVTGTLAHYATWWCNDPGEEHFRLPREDETPIAYFYHLREDGAEKCVARAIAALEGLANGETSDTTTRDGDGAGRP